MAGQLVKLSLATSLLDLLGQLILPLLPDLGTLRGLHLKARFVRATIAQGYGHYKAQCPNRVMDLSSKQPMDDIEEEIYDPQHLILEAERALEDDLQDHDYDELVHVLCSALITRATQTDEDWRRNNIFQTRVRCNGQLFSMVINGGSSTNVVFANACKKLGLKTKPHSAPWHG